jgi:uncharacterized protein YkwD
MPRLRVFLLALAVGACDSSDPVSPGPIDTEVERFQVLVNEHRASVGCPTLAWNTAVAGVAQAHSEDMVARAYFSHTNPDGESPFDRLASAGIDFSSAAENIAYGYPSADAVLSGWLGSPGHRANIENCALTEHGIGLEATYWTHVFIRP